VRQKDWLTFVASHFDTVEVNSSFYRIPKPEMITRWHELAPPGFEFALKMWRGITQYNKLKNADKNVAKFLAVAELLPLRRRGPMLIQLPPNQSIDVEKLDAFLHEWKQTADSRWRLAIEFRHDSWLAPETMAVLDRHRAALCLHDMAGKSATSQPNSNASFIYVRRHGSADTRYGGSYTAEQIEEDRNRIREWTRSGRNVYFYFNNDIGGHAFYNALELKKQLEAV